MNKIDFSKIYLGTSSQGKLDEYNSFGLSLKNKIIPDAPEVLGTEEEVIIYKALNFGENILVEDTSLHVEGEDFGVNIKWLIKELHQNQKYDGKKASWLVYLGLIYQKQLYLTKEEVKGSICTKKGNKQAFGFDSVFIPDGEVESLWELKQKNYKDKHSARKKAITKLLNQQFDKVIPVETIPMWTGKYQK